MKSWSKEQAAAFNKAWSKIIAKAWSDPAFKQRLIKEPQIVLKENGIEVPAGMEYKITENTEKTVYLNLPAKPEGMEGEDYLKKVSGGDPMPTWSTTVHGCT